eukprot:TRINITY_DN10317_c0_g1_i1.p1 TRINITY_DN10317_c0_g1~~TRINITY_DN10317_c0_g1_i1.p1  ORF type:complete len:486 (-),score=161.21 TRINITY_DN10317_c0_g1_i1:127-1563(-)
MEDVGLTSQEKGMDLFDYHQNVLKELSSPRSSQRQSVEIDLNQSPTDLEEVTDFIQQLVREEEEEFLNLQRSGVVVRVQPYFDVTPPNRLHDSPVKNTEKKRTMASVDETEPITQSNPKHAKPAKKTNRDDLLGFQRKKPNPPRASHLLATSVIPSTNSRSDPVPSSPISSEKDEPTSRQPVISKPVPSSISSPKPVLSPIPSKSTPSNANHTRSSNAELSSDTEEDEMARTLSNLAGNESEGEVVEISRPVQLEDKLKNRSLPEWMVDPQYLEMKVREQDEVAKQRRKKKEVLRRVIQDEMWPTTYLSLIPPANELPMSGRVIIFDLETTGISLNDGIVEIGAVELIDNQRTGIIFQSFCNNSEFKIHPLAFEAHGISEKFLEDKPPVSFILENFLKFVGNSPMVAHNMPFDLRMLNQECSRFNLKMSPELKAYDTLRFFRENYPSLPTALSSIARYFQIKHLYDRKKHGALIGISS